MQPHTLLIGTMDGLCAARLNGGRYEVERLDLDGTGAVFFPTQDVDREGRYYAATWNRGVVRSDDAGASWTEMTDGLRYKHLWSLAQDSSTGRLYAGSEPAAIFVSDDAGDHWEELPTLRRHPDSEFWAFPTPPHIAHVKHIDVGPSAPGRILAAIEEGWIARSEDGGETWENIKDNVAFDSHTIYTMPNDPDIVLTSSATGLSRSEDGGRTYAESVDGLTHSYLTHLVVHPKTPDVVMTSAAEVKPPLWRARPIGANAAFFRSDDQGRTWARRTSGVPDVITAAPRCSAGDPDDPDVFLSGFNDGSVWMTTDGGDSYREVLSGLGFVFSIAVMRS